MKYEVKDADTGVQITTKYNAVDFYSVNRVSQQTLDGKYYVQVIGDAAHTVELEVSVDSNGKNLIETADAEAHNISVTLDGGIIFTGAILSRDNWTNRNYIEYSTTIKLGEVES